MYFVAEQLTFFVAHLIHIFLYIFKCRNCDRLLYLKVKKVVNYLNCYTYSEICMN